MIITIIVAVAAFVATLSVVGAIATSVRARKMRQQENALASLPAHERLAQGYERQGDDMISAGSPSAAERLYRDAARVRRDAHEALMKGEQPLLNDDVEPYSAIGNRPTSRHMSEYVETMRRLRELSNSITRLSNDVHELKRATATKKSTTQDMQETTRDLWTFPELPEPITLDLEQVHPHTPFPTPTLTRVDLANLIQSRMSR